MSISVVPAAAAAARVKQIGQKKKRPIKKPEDEQVVQSEERATDADKAQLQGEHREGRDENAPGLGGASFRSALANASALQGADPVGGSSSDSDDNNEALLIGGGVLLLGGGIALAASGGDDDDTPTPTPTPTPTNTAPTFTSAATAKTNEDTPLAGTVTATDANNDALTFALATKATNGTVTVDAAGKYTYTPNANFNGTDTFTVSVTDGKVATPVTQTITVTVAAVNDAPTVAATQTVSGNEDTPIAITVAATDVDGDTLTYAAAGAANGKVTVAEGGKLTYTPNADFAGTDTFTVTISDGKGGTATQTVTVNVANVAETRSIDVGDNNNAVTFNAGTDAFLFTDNSGQTTNVIINNLAAGDRIEVTGSSANYNFTSVGNDIQITFNNTAAGVLNTIVLPGLAKNGGFVFNEATAEAVAGFDFFNALTLPGGNGSGDGVAAAGGNLDDDNDANVLTRATTSAASGNVAFTESATIANNIAITDFTAGDTIAVSGAPTSSYSFGTAGTDGKDIQIVFNNNGVVSQIVLVGANASGATINNEATAEAAVGSNFFQAAQIGTPPTTQTIDNGQSLATVDAAAGSINFTDNALVSTNVIITGFTANDLITVTGRTAADYNFTSLDGKDLNISYTTNDGSASNSIVLDDVFVNAPFINNYQTAVAAIGFNFMAFA